VIEGFNPTLLLVLNLAGTFVFGLSGGLAGVRARLDAFGVAVLAVAVALAGGVIRDVLIGRRPETFHDWRYLAVAGGAGLVAFVAGGLVDRYVGVVDVFDAAGLSLFSVSGASIALQYRVPAVDAVAIGTFSAIGGGMTRDVLMRRVPVVLHEGL
jgi:uncharacterized membrane protein YeiH